MESVNPNSGPGGKGWSDSGVAFTLEARAKPQSVAIPVVVHGTQDPDINANQAHTLGRNRGQENAVFFTTGKEQSGVGMMRVRRLTPL